MQDNPQEFEKLRKLIALKRHEVPPPGYFDNFSRDLIGRIGADPEAQPGMWQQFLAMFRARPAISWSFGAAAVFVLFAASSAFENQPANSLPSMAETGGASAAASVMLSTNFNPPIFGQASVALEPSTGGSTNVQPKLDSLFSTPFYHQVHPASYTP